MRLFESFEAFLACGETGTTAWGCHSRHFWLRFVHLRLQEYLGLFWIYRDWNWWFSITFQHSGERSQIRRFLPQGLKLGGISELKTSEGRNGKSTQKDKFGKFKKKLGDCGDCWWFLVDANHRSEVIANYQQNSGSWCPVWVQVSLMLLVVEELVGCASPFLDRDSTLICSCFKSTQHSTDQKIAVLCCSFSERTLESTFRFDLSNLADGVLSLLSYLVRPRFKPIFHHP